jgi:hypothetical protein
MQRDVTIQTQLLLQHVTQDKRIKIKRGEKEREGLLLLVPFPVLWVIMWQSFCLKELKKIPKVPNQYSR